MPDIADTVVEDIAMLLTDCGREFRKQGEGERAKLQGSLSMVEARDANLYAERYFELADACDRYVAVLSQPEVSAAVGGD